MKSRRSKVSIESIMVMLLMIAFSIAVSLMITQGSQIFKKSIDNKEEDENLRIAMSYINMRIKQNDYADKINIVPNAVEGLDAIVIEHINEEEGYKSYIYYDDGYLYECYTDETPTQELSTQVIHSNGIRFEERADRKQLVIYYGQRRGEDMIDLEQIITLRSN